MDIGGECDMPSVRRLDHLEIALAVPQESKPVTLCVHELVGAP